MSDGINEGGHPGSYRPCEWPDVSEYGSDYADLHIDENLELTGTGSISATCSMDGHLRLAETTPTGQAEVARVRDTGAVKNDVGKMRFDLVPASAEDALVAALTYGSTKYGDRNWELGFPWMDIYASLRRHINAWKKGKDIDDGPKGSGLPHLWLALCNVAFLIEYSGTHPELDNRPNKKARETKAFDGVCERLRKNTKGDKQ